MRLGIYIHFPWCRKRCPYCDFAIAVAKSEPPHQEYLESVLAELHEKAPLFAGKKLVSIYFGGGTPSLWEPRCMAALVNRICEYFDADKTSLEISLESNPSDCQPEAFAGWQLAGVNRLLIGTQATNNNDLLTLGRDHSMGDGLSALKLAKVAGFKSVGTDLILGVPQSVQPKQSLYDIAEQRPPHISTYELTIEERTPFAKAVRKGLLIPESEDVMAQIYMETHDYLTGLGYEHYEVSSFAEIGHRSLHNSLYWQGADYLGLGNGAASLLCFADGSARRWQNLRSASRYMQRTASQHVETLDEISASEFSVEKLWTAMRTSDGVCVMEKKGREEVFAKLLEDGLVKEDSGRIAPTLKGFLYNNQLISRLAYV